MTRVIIGWENVEKVPGQFIESNAVQLPEVHESIVITDRAQQDRESMPIGQAKDFWRQEDGSITAEVDINIPKDLHLTMYLDSAEYKYGLDGVIIITKARLCSLFVADDGLW